MSQFIQVRGEAFNYDKTTWEGVCWGSIRIILCMMGAACEMPNPSLNWQDLAIQKLNRLGNSKLKKWYFDSGAGPHCQIPEHSTCPSCKFSAEVVPAPS